MATLSLPSSSVPLTTSATAQFLPSHPMVPIDSSEVTAIDELVAGIAALKVDAPETYPALYARRKRVVDEAMRASCISATQASRIIPVFSALSQLQLELGQKIITNRRLIALHRNAVYAQALQLYTTVTTEIEKIVSVVDKVFKPSETTVTECERKLKKIYSKKISPEKDAYVEHKDARKLYEDLTGYFHDVVVFLKSKNSDLNRIKESLVIPVGSPHPYSVDSNAKCVPVAIRVYIGSFWSFMNWCPKSVAFVEGDITKLATFNKEVNRKLKELTAHIAAGTDCTDLPGSIETFTRQFQVIESEIQRCRSSIHTIDSPVLMRVIRNYLRDLSESVQDNQQLLNFIKTFDQKDTRSIFTVQRIIHDFLEYLEGCKKSEGEKSASDSFQLALRGFRACNALLQILALKPNNAFLQERIEFLREAVASHVVDVFQLTTSEKLIPHLLLCHQKVSTDELKAYVTKKMGHYLFCRALGEVPDVEVEIVTHLLKNEIDLSEIEDLCAQYFMKIENAKIQNEQHLDKFVEVLSFIHTKLLVESRDSLLFLQAWHYYFQLTLLFTDKTQSLLYIAEKLRDIARDKKYFQINIDNLGLNGVAQERSGLSLHAFVKALGDAIWEKEESRLLEANKFVTFCLQSPDFQSHIASFRHDAYFLISLNLQRKLKEGKYQTIIPEECLYALENGFLKELIDSEGSRGLEQDMVSIFKLLFYVERIDPNQDFQMQVNNTRPLFTVMVNKFGVDRLKEWYLGYYSLVAAPDAPGFSGNRLRQIAGRPTAAHPGS